jgi:phospholipase/carboxylesterase
MLDAVVIEPTEAQSAGTVIWMHGLGANGHDFEPIVPMLDTPHLRYVFPHAPEIPVTINAGFVMPAWYDIRTLHEGPNREDREGILRSAEQIRELIQHEIDCGVPPDAILLAGFSQGAAMALYVGLRYPERLRGIMALSSYLVLPDRLQSEATAANRGTPVLMCHGEHDDTVPCSRGEAARDALIALTPDRSLEWHTYAMQHEVCPDEIAVIGEWLRRRY